MTSLIDYWVTASVVWNTLWEKKKDLLWCCTSFSFVIFFFNGDVKTNKWLKSVYSHLVSVKCLPSGWSGRSVWWPPGSAAGRWPSCAPAPGVVWWHLRYTSGTWPQPPQPETNTRTQPAKPLNICSCKTLPTVAYERRRVWPCCGPLPPAVSSCLRFWW